MPVSFIPLITVAVFGASLLWFICLRSKESVRTFSVVAGLLCLVLLWNFVPGGVYWLRTHAGDASAMYELARWTESHDEDIGEIVLWPFQPNVLGGYRWLEQAAALKHPPSLYAVGVRLKHGIFVPEPPNWTGPGGNVFEQPERGQPLIDEAIRLGYQPKTSEEHFYFGEYRRVWLYRP